MKNNSIHLCHNDKAYFRTKKYEQNGSFHSKKCWKEKSHLKLIYWKLNEKKKQNLVHLTYFVMQRSIFRRKNRLFDFNSLVCTYRTKIHNNNAFLRNIGQVLKKTFAFNWNLRTVCIGHISEVENNNRKNQTNCTGMNQYHCYYNSNSATLFMHIVLFERNNCCKN